MRLPNCYLSISRQSSRVIYSRSCFSKFNLKLFVCIHKPKKKINEPFAAILLPLAIISANFSTIPPSTSPASSNVRSTIYSISIVSKILRLVNLILGTGNMVGQVASQSLVDVRWRDPNNGCNERKRMIFSKGETGYIKMKLNPSAKCTKAPIDSGALHVKSNTGFGRRQCLVSSDVKNLSFVSHRCQLRAS